MRIVLPFCLGTPPRGFYHEFMAAIAEALLELGHTPLPFAFARMLEARPEEAQALGRMLDSERPDAAIDVAGWGCALTQVLAKHPHLGSMAYVALLLDQPHNQPLNGISSPRLYGAYPDLDHPAQVRLLFPGIRLAGEMLAPPAIRRSRDYFATATERDIDVLYVGNLSPRCLARFWSDPTHPVREGDYDVPFCDALFEAVLAEPKRSFHLAVKAALLQSPKVRPGRHLQIQLRAVEMCLRQCFRRDAVLAVARSGVNLLVVGRGWESLRLPGNVKIIAQTDYEGLFRLAARAKVSLDASTYIDGVNDRVFSYALNHSVCFTNATGLLRTLIGEERGIFFYSIRDLEALAESIKGLLGSPERLREAGERAHETVLGAHTWRHRVSNLLSQITAS